MKKITIKRPVTIKTIVTDEFKKQTEKAFSKELELIDIQISQQEREIEELKHYSKNLQNPNDINQAVFESTKRLEQIVLLKQDLLAQSINIENIKSGETIITGNLENYVELKEGDNLYDKFKSAEIIVEDDIIKKIIN